MLVWPDGTPISPGKLITWAGRRYRPSQVVAIYRRLCHVVRQSMAAERYAERHTQVEVEREARRRLELCERLMAELSGDLHWGPDRCLDQLPRYLRRELDRDRFEPDPRAMWRAETEDLI
jgi:hypothetical protein